MSGFEENNCRLCNKTFCCPKCRLKHEIKIHHILPECNLCIFGYSVFDDIVKEDQFEHLKNVHFPLNCVYCRRIFTSVAEIRQHQKCSILHQSNDSPKTPFRQDNPLEIDEEAQDSPILQELQRKESLNYIFNLATSTPMQRIQEPVRFNKNQVPDTPIIINIEKNSQTINKSIIKKIDSRVDSMKGDNSSKRRVTFGETSEKSEKNKSIASENIGNKTSTPEYSQEKVSKSPVTPASRNKSDQFYSAKSHISSAKTNDFLRQTPSSQGFTPLGVPHTSKLKTVKGNIYASSDLLPPNVDEKDCNLLTTSNNENLILNAVSMNLCAAEEIHSNLETYADNDDLNLIDLSSTSMECFPPNSLNIGQSATDAGDSKKVDQLKLIDNFFTPASLHKVIVKRGAMDSNEKNIKQYQFTAGNQQILSAEIKQENIEKEMLVPEKSQISTAVADNPPKIVIKGATYRSSNETINKQHNSTEANEQMFSVSEVKQKTIKDDELELDVKDSKLSTPEVRKNIPDKSPEYSEEKICDSAVTPATGIKNEQFYTAKSGFNECGSPKKHEYLRKRPPLCEGLTPVGISHVSKVMSAKGDIYTSADLRSPNVLDGKKCNLTTSYENLNTTDLNEISIELDGQQSFSRPEMEKEDNLQVYLSDNLKEPEISKHGNFKKMAAVDSNSSDKTNRHDFSETLLCNIPIVDIKQELNEENNAFDICYDHNDPQTEETVNETNKQYNFLSDDQQSFLRPEIKQEVIKNDNLQEYLSDDLNFKKLAALDSTSSDETDRHDFSETLLCNIPMVDIKQELIEENNALDMCHDHNDRQTEETNLSNCKTLWLSASNLDDFNNTEEDNDENKDPNINLTNLSTKSLRNALNDIINTRKNLENKCPTIKEAANSKTTDILDSSVVLLKDKDDESNIKEVINSNISDIPDYVATSSKLRVNNGISTPILKKKDVHIKLCFPANFGSMSIASSGAAKLKHTHNKEEISTQVIKQQTPFKTPQSKFQNFLLENEPGTSSTNSALIQLPEKHLAMGHSQIVNDENSQSLVSVSSMTESSLWTSMTRIVKRVLGITNQNEDIFDNCPNNNSISFKRQLSSESDSDSDFNFSAAPRPKRFKFSDIKCRRPIRDEYALELPSRISPSSNRVATFEIVKSVRTYDGRRYVRRMCDKATQTDDYLMDGLQPQTN